MRVDQSVYSFDKVSLSENKAVSLWVSLSLAQALSHTQRENRRTIFLFRILRDQSATPAIYQFWIFTAEF